MGCVPKLVSLYLLRQSSCSSNRGVLHNYLHETPLVRIWVETLTLWHSGAGTNLLDMEFVQFFPIGHLAPRLVGMDPIMWDPFRYKLGGKLLNGQNKQFIENYGGEDGETYKVGRDLAAFAIIKECRLAGSPNGGAWLSFQHLTKQQLEDAFGPIIEKLASNNMNQQSSL